MPSLQPYYQDESVTLYHGDCREVLADLGDQSVDCVLTDPPYTERTHKKARTPEREGVTTFGSITDDDLRAILADLGRVSRGWVVSTLDYRHAVEFDVTPPAGLKCQRVGVWVKTNPTPQLYMHRADKRSTWSGGGKHGNFVSPIPPPEGHPTAKPLPMLRQWVQWFTERGQTVLDPFAGSGTTLRAALDEGRKAIGVEREERYCELIASRLAQGAFDFGVTA